MTVKTPTRFVQMYIYIYILWYSGSSTQQVGIAIDLTARGMAGTCSSSFVFLS